MTKELVLINSRDAFMSIHFHIELLYSQLNPPASGHPPLLKGDSQIPHPPIYPAGSPLYKGELPEGEGIWDDGTFFSCNLLTDSGLF